MRRVAESGHIEGEEKLEVVDVGPPEDRGDRVCRPGVDIVGKIECECVDLLKLA